MGNHATLITALEAAREGSRELDARIGAHLLGGTPAFEFDDWRKSYGAGAIFEGNRIVRHVPLYTADVSSAIALVERVKPGWSWSVHKEGIAQLCPCNEYGEPMTKYEIEVIAPTPALALCLALLRAETEKTHD